MEPFKSNLPYDQTVVTDTYTQWFFQGLYPQKHQQDTDSSIESKTWLEEVKTILIHNMDDPGYTVLKMAEELCLSDRQLRRKLKRITGMGPLEMLTRMRLRLAYHLIITKQYKTIVQVARATGFSHASAFSRAFKKQYNQSPSELWRV